MNFEVHNNEMNFPTSSNESGRVNPPNNQSNIRPNQAAPGMSDPVLVPFQRNVENELMRHWILYVLQPFGPPGPANQPMDANNFFNNFAVPSPTVPQGNGVPMYNQLYNNRSPANPFQSGSSGTGMQAAFSGTGGMGMQTMRGDKSLPVRPAAMHHQLSETGAMDMQGVRRDPKVPHTTLPVRPKVIPAPMYHQRYGATSFPNNRAVAQYPTLAQQNNHAFGFSGGARSGALPNPVSGNTAVDLSDVVVKEEARGYDVPVSRTDNISSLKLTEEWYLKIFSEWLHSRNLDGNATKLDVDVLRHVLPFFYETFTITTIKPTYKGVILDESLRVPIMARMRMALYWYLKNHHPSRPDITTFEAAEEAFRNRHKNIFEIGNNEKFSESDGCNIAPQLEMLQSLIDKDVNYHYHCPITLLFKVCIDLWTYFGMRTNLPMHEWKIGNVVYMFDIGIKKSFFTWREPGRVGNEPRMYATGTSTCPVLSMVMYLSKSTPHNLAGSPAALVHLWKRFNPTTFQQDHCWFGPESLSSYELNELMNGTPRDPTLFLKRHAVLRSSTYPNVGMRYSTGKSVLDGADCIEHTNMEN